MPGHKRQAAGILPEEIYKIDITEIDGFDDLHMPEGILRSLQEQAAEMYGAEESFYLVNGSTCGILSAVSAAVPYGGKLLMARNCHKSAYHAAYLRGLQLRYLYPDTVEGFDVVEAITPQQVLEALEAEKDIKAVLIVSPTYEGRIADIKGIAEVVHAKGLPLIVDEAHGAHFGLHPLVQECSIRLGADIVIASVHKTLPGLTQTALLHVSGERIDRNAVKRFLHIYQTSSPSYVLMAGIDSALKCVRENGESLYPVFYNHYRELLKELESCKNLRFLPMQEGRQDIGKLVISVKDTSMNGHELAEILHDKYHLQLEMATATYGLAMFTLCDTEEGYQRMAQALKEIDKAITSKQSGFKTAGPDYPDPDDAIPFAEAWDAPARELPLAESAEMRAAEFINLYPPGVPLLVPGERITEDNIRTVDEWLKQGFAVRGVSRTGEGCKIRVLKQR